MKRSFLLGIIAAMAASCTVQEADVLLEERANPVFYATFEQPEEDTKVYANEQLLIRWHKDDRVSIFEKYTYNQQYQFTGKTGDKSGNFQKVEGDGYVTGNAISDIVAVYPYQQETSIAEDEVLTLELPAEQIYAQNSFGRGANAMVSVSTDNVLMFKNVGAYLMFSLYGEDVSVSSITLRGNNGEKLSGKAYVTMPLNGVPSVQVVGDATEASTVITLRCDTPVTLGASAAEFWFVVPPVTFSKGFTITITQPNGGTVEKSTSRSVALTRNKLSRMEPIEVEKAASPEPEGLTPVPVSFDGNKRGTTTYQLLVYSFADSDGDGVGDFKGIEQKLDYLDGLGVTALWLSPIHPADSYHGYDVQDYFAVNPQFGTEADFRSLLDKAHAKGIKIYIDYVLNHSGKSHPWFLKAMSDPSSPYRNYYFISTNPQRDYSSFPMLNGSSYNAGDWVARAGGSPKLRITRTSEPVTNSDAEGWNLYNWGGTELKGVSFLSKGDGSYYMVKDIYGTYGFLIRKMKNWNPGSKYGAKAGEGTLVEGKEMSLVGDGADISFTGNGRYKIELTNVNSIETVYVMCAFGEWMPDLNYGEVSQAENNACFQDLAASADKWIQMGIDGFRLDAVKHICGGIWSYSNSGNQTFLKKWYDHCNATYHAAGHTDDIFMVGEVWSGHQEEKNYYRGINSCFEFEYWDLLYNAIVSHNASGYVSSVSAFIREHKAVRPDAETAIFMTNHDHSSKTGNGQARAADDLGRDLRKEKQAAAMLLTSPGKPFIYQGEELGYWGNADGKGDEYIRAPIVWDAAARDCAKKGVNNKVDAAMLKGDISVETQTADENSLLNTYKTWSRLRNSYEAIASGDMAATSISAGSAVTSWYMTAGSQRLLVIHNCGTGARTMTVEDSIARPVAVLGGATASGKELTLDAYSSVVFEL